ncbi:type II secretion system F family protein [Alkalibacillus haloalkaliphilus]|uniref:Secretion system protein n=1 Tax=Alkalibacillus haloalkaliphilus TaxID=94136 RepID=A0A511W106_9BACI|nr:type II secretion system F family protein [Alkalibacillus haloalkaliphilus]GEN44401.1 secretion system protein [Alkalibacillus haloalkaliphilus]
MIDALLFGSFFLTVTLLIMALFSKVLLRNDQMKKRVNQYLFEEEESTNKGEREKQRKVLVEFRLTKERIRKSLKKKDKGAKLAMDLHQAGIPLKPEEFIMFKWISILLTGGIAYLIFNHVLFLIIGLVVGRNIPKVVVSYKKKKRIKQFNDHLAEMISSIVSALKAGFSFPQALQNVRNESPYPVKDELELMLREMQYGTSLEESLNRLKERVPSDDLDLMIQAIVIQRQVGGNLAVVLEQIVFTIRERVKIQGQIQTLTAQGRMSGLVVGLLPVILMGMLYVVNPDYMTVMFIEPIGVILLILAAISATIGFLLVRRITSIEV